MLVQTFLVVASQKEILVSAALVIIPLLLVMVSIPTDNFDIGWVLVPVPFGVLTYWLFKAQNDGWAVVVILLIIGYYALGNWLSNL